jgi:glutathione-specific gamma-glutamylcyclotransferase
MSPPSSTSATVAYFGYGSLVNELTWLQSERRHPERYPVEIANWSREWGHCVDTPRGPMCVLTAVEQAGSRIQGILIRCDAADLAQIDAREDGYDRIELPRRDVLSPVGDLPEKLYIYKSRSPHYRPGGVDFPIWFSYVEAVLHGFLSVFKTEGVDAFIRSTSGWTVPVVDDREDPQYGRSPKKLISADDKVYIEQKIRQITGIRIIEAAGAAGALAAQDRR